MGIASPEKKSKIFRLALVATKRLKSKRFVRSSSNSRPATGYWCIV